MYSFQFQHHSQPADQWTQRPQAWKFRATAEREASKFADIMAGLGGHVKTRVVELEDDGRRGKVPAHHG